VAFSKIEEPAARMIAVLRRLSVLSGRRAEQAF
jgi:hypothetical protein